MYSMPGVERTKNTITIKRLGHPKCVSDFIRCIKDCILHGYTDIYVDSIAEVIYPNACVPIAGIIQYYITQGISFSYNLDERSYLNKCAFTAPRHYSDDDNLDVAYAYPLDKIYKFDSFLQVAKLSQAYVDAISHLCICEPGVIDSMDTSTPMRRATTRTLSPRKISVSAAYCLYSSASEQFTKSTLSVTVGRSQPASNSACAALRISA